MQEVPGLDQLNDIVIPSVPPLWPPATEALLLTGIILYIVFIALIQRNKKRKANAYRLLGLELLKDAQTTYDISIILKRVALAAYPREQVASLYGKDWQNFLEQSARRHKYSNYSDFSGLVNANPDELATKKQKQLAASWIKKHRGPTNRENS